MSAFRTRILVAEDDDALRALLTTNLEREGYQVIPIEDGLELSDYFELVNPGGARTLQPDLVLTDVRMPGRTGIDAVSHARQAGLTCPVLILTAFADDDVLRTAAELGHTVVLSKPLGAEAVVGVVRQMLSATPAA
jgi:CheY-like chemotaxis protein